MLQELSKVYKPFNYSQFVKWTIDHEVLFWGEWEASLQSDVRQWQSTIQTGAKDHITQILRLFTQSDQIVGGSYADIFIPYFRNNEVRMGLLSIANRESTHVRAYALLNDTLGLHESEYSAFMDFTEMSNKAEFMMDFYSLEECKSSPSKMAKNIALTVINEGLSLFSAFAQLLAYQRPEGGAQMLGMCSIVEWSVRDETKHVEMMTQLFQLYCKENPEIVTDLFKASIYSMFRKAVDLEDKFIDLSFRLEGPAGLTAEDVKQYIRFIADRRLTQLGLKPNWGVSENPLPWIDHIIGGASHTNFFESRVTDYSHKGLQGDFGWK